MLKRKHIIYRFNPLAGKVAYATTFTRMATLCLSSFNPLAGKPAYVTVTMWWMMPCGWRFNPLAGKVAYATQARHTPIATP
ncbi:MAG: hypothetical protein AAF126_17630 [Chloroflexota bacterium]